MKAPPTPSYSTVLNNTGSNDKSSNLYMNAPSPYVALDIKNDFSQMASANGKEASKPAPLYQNNDSLYACQPEDKFEPKYRYDEKNYYSNIGNMPAPQVPVDDRASRATIRNAVYSNIEPPVPIPVPAYKYPNEAEKDIIYSNIQWNPKTENTYCNVPPAHSAGNEKFLFYDIKFKSQTNNFLMSEFKKCLLYSIYIYKKKKKEIDVTQAETK